MKFKVGDKVKLKKGLIIGKVYGGLNLYDSMISDIEGKEVTISKLTPDGFYRIEDSRYAYSEEMLYPSFHVGDYVFISSTSPIYPGKIGVIIQVDRDDSIYHYLIGLPEGGDRYWIEDKLLSKYTLTPESTSCAKAVVQETPFDFSDCVSTTGVQVQYKEDCCGTGDTLTIEESSIISVNPSKVKLYMI